MTTKVLFFSLLALLGVMAFTGIGGIQVSRLRSDGNGLKSKGLHRRFADRAILHLSFQPARFVTYKMLDDTSRQLHRFRASNDLAMHIFRGFFIDPDKGVATVL